MANFYLLTNWIFLPFISQPFCERADTGRLNIPNFMKILFGNLNRIATICDLLSLGKLSRRYLKLLKLKPFEIWSFFITMSGFLWQVSTTVHRNIEPFTSIIYKNGLWCVCIVKLFVYYLKNEIIYVIHLWDVWLHPQLWLTILGSASFRIVNSRVILGLSLRLFTKPNMCQ